MDRVRPKSDTTRRAYELLALSNAIPEADKRYRCAYISSFLDDLPLICVQSVADDFQMIQSAMWHELGFVPQGKKCWWEGGFATK
jgi:hypothetical protein